MSNHSFMFLDKDFKDISKFCMRMEKNIVEGDGVDAVIWAGKIAERITNYITQFIKLDLKGLKQHEKLERLYEEEVIPDNIYKDFNTIRHYRNIATHRDLRDELVIANNLHRTIFNITRWFYGTYSADESFFNKKYIGITYQHDPSFIDMITNNLALNDLNNVALNDMSANLNSNEGSLNRSIVDSIDTNASYTHNFNSYANKYFSQENVNFNNDLNCWSAVVFKNNKTITIGHFKSKEIAIKRGYAYVNSDEFRNYTYISIPPKLKGGVYSYAKGINFSEKNYLWTASFNKKFLGYFISEGSAITARKQYIDTLPLPEKKNGSYSDYKEISFDENHKLWFIKKDGEIYDYYDSEEEAIYNLANVLNLDIPIEDLGIEYNEDDSKWRFYYKGKFVGAYDSEKEAIEKRLNHISQFAQPKRNKNGDFSVHKGIYYDQKNLIWVLSIKNEIIGFYESEEDAFNSKKEFLRLKGFDVSNLNFNQEEEFDDDFDFKVKLYSDENAVEFNKHTNEWVAYFMGRVIGRASDEDSARRIRKQYLKSMPFVPRKANGEYSNFEGIDYDKDNHLWTSYNGEEFLGLFDSEEDAFYARKEALIANGEDVSDMHFDLNNIKSDEEEDSYLKTNAVIDYKTSSNDYSKSSENESDDDSIMDNDSNLINENNSSSNESISNLQENINFNSSDDEEDLEDENSLKDIENYKKSPLFGIGLKRDENDFSPLDNITYDDLESDLDIEDDDADIDLNNAKVDDNGFMNMNENIDLKLNRHDLKEICLKSFDINNYRSEITVSYNKKNIYLTLEGMIRNKDLEKIMSLNLLENSEKLEFNKVDSDYFSIFFRLKYNLKSMSLDLLFKLLSEFGWNFDLLTILKHDSDTISNIYSNVKENSQYANQFSLNADEIHSNENIGENKLKLDSEVKDMNYSAKEDNVKSDSAKENNLKDDSLKKDNVKTESNLNKSTSNGKKLIRGGKIVTKEEAEKIDNAEPVKEIKSNVISKRPENNKQKFNSYSLEDLIKLDDGDSEDNLENLDDLNANDFDLDATDSGVTSEDVKINAVDSEDIFSFEEDTSFDLDDAISNKEKPQENDSILEKDNLNDSSNLEADSSEDDFSEDDSSKRDYDSIEDVMEILERSKQYDLEHGEDLEESNCVDDVADLTDSGSIDSEENNVISENKPKKVKKPKKAPKVKKLAVDAFDEKYANSLEIEYDEENDKWLAYAGGNFVIATDNPKEAYMARKKYKLRNVSIPRKNMEGKYSHYEGIDFDTSERMWTSSINGIVIVHSLNEKEAIAHRKFFVDKILPEFEIDIEEFDEESLDKIIESGFKKLLKESGESE